MADGPHSSRGISSFPRYRRTYDFQGNVFGPMGLEGAVRLGYKQELAALPEGEQRDARFESLLADMYERGRATEAASFLEIDNVIDPMESRAVIARALRS